MRLCVGATLSTGLAWLALRQCLCRQHSSLMRSHVGALIKLNFTACVRGMLVGCVCAFSVVLNASKNWLDATRLFHFKSSTANLRDHLRVPDARPQCGTCATAQSGQLINLSAYRIALRATSDDKSKHDQRRCRWIVCVCMCTPKVPSLRRLLSDSTLLFDVLKT